MNFLDLREPVSSWTHCAGLLLALPGTFLFILGVVAPSAGQAPLRPIAEGASFTSEDGLEPG